MKRKQIIVAIEGIDGAGKTSLINELSSHYGDKIIVYNRTKKGKLLNRLVSHNIMQKYYMLLVPIYLLLSYKNYILFSLKNNENEIVIMDRCFLSNICYFFPNGIWDYGLLKRLLFFEIKLFPQKIFILDVEPSIGQMRDSNRKSLKWLEKTREVYCKSVNSNLTKWIEFEILEEKLSVQDKSRIIVSYIDEVKKHGNR